MLDICSLEQFCFIAAVLGVAAVSEEAVTASGGDPGRGPGTFAAALRVCLL